MPATESTTASFGRLPDGREAQLVTLRTPQLELTLTNLGARVVNLLTRDGDGVLGDISLGFRDAAAYVSPPNMFFGATIGRFANRIAHGRFELDGRQIQVPVNNGENALHGGPDGFDLRLWKLEHLPDGVAFELVSPDGDQGFPGTLHVRAEYRVDGNAITLLYRATADRTTILNLTNHTYFNLDGEGEGDILSHNATIFADSLTAINENLIPTGESMPVAGTAFDFTTPHRIGERIDWPERQLEIARGYDHNFILRGDANALRSAARVRSPRSGRVLEVATTQPGVQFYSGNFLDGSLTGKSGRTYGARSGFCLETQHFPDSPNQSTFPSTTLHPGEVFTSETRWIFTAD